MRCIHARLFNVYMDGVVREAKIMVLGKGLMKLLGANGGRLEINHLLFGDDTALVADSREKLCRLVNVSFVECAKEESLE